MDGYLEFDTLKECNDVLEKINTELRASAVKNGFTVNDSVIIGKINGESAPKSTGTTTWDVPKELDGLYYIASPKAEILDTLQELGISLTFGDYEPPIQYGV